MVTPNVVITDHQAAFLERLVAEGRYQNLSEAMREGLRGLEERETAFERQRDGILEALAQVERGQAVRGDPKRIVRDAFARGRARAT
jgi:antitoxin ParD1/3/4